MRSSVMGEVAYLGGNGHQGRHQSPQGLLHFLQCGSFILTREFLCWLDLGGGCGLLLFLCPPPPFLGVEGGADGLLLGGILEIRTETK